MRPLPSIGSDFAGYHIESLLGRGGMAEVYLARHLLLGRRVALKLLSPELIDDDTFRERFDRESKQAAAIDHPNNIPIYEAGEVDGVLFIAMRYVAGSDLKVLLRRQGRLDLARTLSIVGQVGGALDAAHAHGLMHRDVKPANILLLERTEPEGLDHAYLSDFGLSKHQDAVSDLTVTGQFVGTIDYTAPEQIEGRPCDGRTDLYALGCVLFESLTGRPPFARDSDVSTIFAHLLDPPPRISEHRPDVPPGLDGVLARALAKAKEDRYATCGQFSAAARTVLAGSGIAVPSTSARVPPPAPSAGLRPVAAAPFRRPSPPGPGREAAPPASPPAAPSRAAKPPPQRLGPAPQQPPPQQPTWRLGQRPKPNEPPST